MNDFKTPSNHAVDTLQQLEMQFLAALEGVRAVLRILITDNTVYTEKPLHYLNDRALLPCNGGSIKKGGRPLGVKNSKQSVEKLERNKRILAMHEAGYSIPRIAEEFGLSRIHIYTILKQLKTACHSCATGVEPEAKQQ